MLFFLKVNREERYTCRCLQHWIDAIQYYDDPKVIIISDKDILNKEIEDKINFHGINASFMTSDYDTMEFNIICRRIAQDIWINAAKAHLCTFFIARDLNESRFWNIDADDTMICLNGERTYQLMKAVEEKTLNESIGICSLDMNYSRYGGVHWSFGVSFTDALNTDWINEIDRFSQSSEYVKQGNILEKHNRKNIDWMFTCFRKEANEKNLQTFYANKLRFIHYSNDFLKRPVLSGLYFWTDKYLEFPILKNCLNLDKMGKVPLADDMICIDINLSEQEGLDYLIESSKDVELINKNNYYFDTALCLELAELNAI